jgi:hypothetical protein
MPPGLTLDQLRNAVSQDTVRLALADMQGRLQMNTVPGMR